jgi:hypothetical protein
MKSNINNIFLILKKNGKIKLKTLDHDNYDYYYYYKMYLRY